MSHWTTVQTKFKNKEAIKKALKRIFPEHEIKFDCNVQGYQGKLTKADIVVVGKNRYDLGFTKVKDGTYTEITDWYGSGRWVGQRETFRNGMKQMYATEVSIHKARQLGYRCKELTTDSGEVHLELVRF